MTASVRAAPTTPRGTASAGRDAAVRHAQRVAGQAAALPSMIAERRPYGDVALQVLAVRGSIDSLMMRLLELELDACLPGADERLEISELLAAALGRRSVVARAAGAPHRATPVSGAPPAPSGGEAARRLSRLR